MFGVIVAGTTPFDGDLLGKRIEIGFNCGSRLGSEQISISKWGVSYTKFRGHPLYLERFVCNEVITYVYRREEVFIRPAMRVAYFKNVAPAMYRKLQEDLKDVGNNIAAYN